jgi:hypothetical protein
MAAPLAGPTPLSTKLTHTWENFSLFGCSDEFFHPFPSTILCTGFFLSYVSWNKKQKATCRFASVFQMTAFDKKQDRRLLDFELKTHMMIGYNML